MINKFIVSEFGGGGGGFFSFIAPIMSVFSSFMGGQQEQSSGPSYGPPPPAAPPPAPTTDTEAVRAKAEADRKRLAAANGYGSTDITKGIFAGEEDTSQTQKPTLLGG